MCIQCQYKEYVFQVNTFQMLCCHVSQIARQVLCLSYPDAKQLYWVLIKLPRLALTFHHYVNVVSSNLALRPLQAYNACVIFQLTF